jgi:hypothetical protein
MTIKLKRQPYGWSYHGFTIIRREWIMPFVGYSYDIMRNDKMIDRCDSLREVRQVLELENDNEFAGEKLIGSKQYEPNIEED